MGLSKKIKVDKKTVLVILIIIMSIISLCSCGAFVSGLSDYIDPHAGMVQVPNGAGGFTWITPIENLEVSNFSSESFSANEEYIDFNGTEYVALRAIDVSEHQQEIDWAAVAADGVQAAIIRAGYRGYGSGTLNVDAFFAQNIQGAIDNGIEVGIYFFSQAITVDEAVAEAEFLLPLMEEYEISLPVFFDWEHVSDVGETRVDNMEETITNCALAFCKVIEDAGYDAGVYFYRSQGYEDYELGQLSHLTFWSAAVGTYPDFYYQHSIWQYSFTGNVSGIEGGVDLDLVFREKAGKMPLQTVVEQ